MALPAAQCKNYIVGLHPTNLIEKALPQLRAFKKKRKEAMVMITVKPYILENLPTLQILISVVIFLIGGDKVVTCL
jgi:hypothetical protein